MDYGDGDDDAEGGDSLNAVVGTVATPNRYYTLCGGCGLVLGLLVVGAGAFVLATY